MASIIAKHLVGNEEVALLTRSGRHRCSGHHRGGAVMVLRLVKLGV